MMTDNDMRDTPDSLQFIEVTLKNKEDFLKVKETLTRIGIASKVENTLWQSCHILHKRGRYYIVHFKEMFLLDGRPASFDDTDYARRNTIVKLLKEWGLVDVVRPLPDMFVPLKQIKIISHADKPNWQLKAKYFVGAKPRDDNGGNK